MLRKKKKMANQLPVPLFSQPGFKSIIPHLEILLLSISVRSEGTTVNGFFKNMT